ncbi:hypothetical protein CW304_05410 [Bacillus sp. UFRGS-B20]|nr:hypothetical protein CW304_05410 [Bacillus sp. UFRGS-B20]
MNIFFATDLAKITSLYLELLKQHKLGTMVFTVLERNHFLKWFTPWQDFLHRNDYYHVGMVCK